MHHTIYLKRKGAFKGHIKNGLSFNVFVFFLHLWCYVRLKKHHPTLRKNEHCTLYPCFLSVYSCESIGVAKKKISGE